MPEIINYSIFGEIGKKKTNLGEFEAPLHVIRKLLYILHNKQRIIKEDLVPDLPDPPASPSPVPVAAVVAASLAAVDGGTCSANGEDFSTPGALHLGVFQGIVKSSGKHYGKVYRKL